MDHSDPKPEEKSKANSNQNWTINVPDVRFMNYLLSNG